MVELIVNIVYAVRSPTLEHFSFATAHKFDEFRWEYSAVLGVVLPFYLFTAWWYSTFNRVESVRAFSHIREALGLYQHCLKGRFKVESAKRVDLNSLYSAVEPPSEYDIPSCTFISVLRNAEWRRLPYNLVVTGDVIKLRFGDVAPCDLAQVSLVRLTDDERGENNEGSGTRQRYRYVLRSTGRLFQKGSVFGLRDVHINPVSSALRNCPVLSYAIFVVLQTPCVTLVHRFLIVGNVVYPSFTNQPECTPDRE
eukprot:Gregarina_sp_Poly_1__7866@NODE_446_length_8330_cov_67_406269_g364_i0_p3_GENE_NODE_446_length_8330_cov_67_406269_g364_i0NODE_446_length_8330_cov_67_406269_g364_i0_p3_ORF_typecomplete_len253_score20_12E1E2_ATPase/PF00122_20/7_4e03E1E2_ATPase/PF00122_20/6_1e06_NODE_446_length_8330_cov_67_406269_g364_i075718329